MFALLCISHVKSLRITTNGNFALTHGVRQLKPVFAARASKPLIHSNLKFPEVGPGKLKKLAAATAYPERRSRQSIVWSTWNSVGGKIQASPDHG